MHIYNNLFPLFMYYLFIYKAHITDFKIKTKQSLNHYCPLLDWPHRALSLLPQSVGITFYFKYNISFSPLFTHPLCTGCWDLCWFRSTLAGGFPLPSSGHSFRALLQMQVQTWRRWPSSYLKVIFGSVDWGLATVPWLPSLSCLYSSSWGVDVRLRPSILSELKLRG